MDFFLIVICALLLVFAYLWFHLRKQLKQQAYQLKQLQEKKVALENEASVRNQRWDVLLSTVSEVVLHVDKQGRILGGNAQASALFNLDSTSKLPQKLLLFYRDSEWVAIFEQAVRALPEQTSLPEMNVDGRVFLARLASIDSEEAVLLCTDVTAYTLLQRKQKSLLENLMHDLKTPLTSLLGYARSIETFADDEALRAEAATVIAQEAKHINSLVNSMLTLNQIESQPMASNRACDIEDILKQVWQGLDYAMQQKGVRLNFVVEQQLPAVRMIDVDCHRILMNVADNAVHYSPKNAAITCSVQVDDRDIHLTIQDEGHGVPEKYIKRITERFYRVDNVRGRAKSSGHGLGLAIVKETLEREGGALRIANVETGGLAVELIIPKA